VVTKRIVWVKVNPDCEIAFRLMDGLGLNAGRCYWIRIYETLMLPPAKMLYKLFDLRKGVGPLYRVDFFNISQHQLRLTGARFL